MLCPRLRGWLGYFNHNRKAINTTLEQQLKQRPHRDEAYWLAHHLSYIARPKHAGAVLPKVGWSTAPRVRPPAGQSDGGNSSTAAPSPPTPSAYSHCFFPESAENPSFYSLKAQSRISRRRNGSFVADLPNFPSGFGWHSWLSYLTLTDAKGGECRL